MSDLRERLESLRAKWLLVSSGFYGDPEARDLLNDLNADLTALLAVDEAPVCEQKELEAKAPAQKPQEARKYTYGGVTFDVDHRGELVRPKEIEHLRFQSDLVLCRLENEGGKEAELAKKELHFREAVYSMLGQG